MICPNCRAEFEELQAKLELLEKANDTIELPLAHIDFSPTERAIIARLQRARGKFVSREQLYVSIYGGEPDVGPNIIGVYIHKLRKKLNDTGWYIKTGYGQGVALLEGYDSGLPPKQERWTNREDKILMNARSPKQAARLLKTRTLGAIYNRTAKLRKRAQ